MTLYALKPRFQALLRPLAKRLAASGVTANQVTIATCLGSIVVALLLIAWEADYYRQFLLLPLWLFARLALNALDGMLAREFAQKSRLGAYLNELGDAVSDAVLYAPFALIVPFAPIWVVLVAMLSILAEFAGVLGPLIGASRRYDGPLGKSDRSLFLGAFGLWIGIGGAPPPWLAWSMPLMAFLLTLTIANRVRSGLAEAALGDSR